MTLQKRVTHFNKRYINRVTGLIAGARYSPVALIRHKGRKSGKWYQTPMMAARIPGGFIFELTYGPNVDWYQNVLASGQAQLRWYGKEYALENPEPVETKTGMAAFPQPFRFFLGLAGLKHYMRMKIKSG